MTTFAYPLLRQVLHICLYSSSLVYWVRECEHLRFNYDLMQPILCAYGRFLLNENMRLVFVAFLYDFDDNRSLVMYLEIVTFLRFNLLWWIKYLVKSHSVSCGSMMVVFDDDKIIIDVFCPELWSAMLHKQMFQFLQYQFCYHPRNWRSHWRFFRLSLNDNHVRKHCWRI